MIEVYDTFRLILLLIVFVIVQPLVLQDEVARLPLNEEGRGLLVEVAFA